MITTKPMFNATFPVLRQAYDESASVLFISEHEGIALIHPHEPDLTRITKSWTSCYDYRTWKPPGKIEVYTD